MTLNTLAPTWKFKTLVDDTVIFGGDLAATGSSPNAWSSGAYSQQRAFLIDTTDYLELDLTFDAKTNGHGISVGLSNFYPGLVVNSANWDANWVFATDQTLTAYEQGSLRYTAGASLPMSCRIIYNAGVLTFRSNAGSDILRYTSLRTVAAIRDVMRIGLSVMVVFWGTSGKLHLTLKGGDSSSPEVAGTSTGRIGTQVTEARVLMPSLGLTQTRTLEIGGLWPYNPHPRPQAGKIWPRKI